jgi:hypothetical protein
VTRSRTVSLPLDIVGERLEAGTLDDLYMAPVADFQNPAGGKGSEGPADGRKRRAHVLGDIRAVHRKVYLVRRFFSGSLKVFQHLEKSVSFVNVRLLASTNA